MNQTEAMIMVILLLFIISSINANAESNCPDGHWFHSVGKKSTCCEYCSPGQYMLEPCNTVNRTKCAVCPAGTFTAGPNRFKKCLTCATCSLSHGFKLKKKCTRVSNVECSCVPGYYIAMLHNLCKKCSTCKPGFEISKPCTADSNRECRSCSLGETFEQKGKCIKCSQCKVKEIKQKNCTIFKDTVCEKFVPLTFPPTPTTRWKENDSGNTTKPIFISISVVFVFVALCVFLCWIKKYGCFHRRADRHARTERLEANIASKPDSLNKREMVELLPKVPNTKTHLKNLEVKDRHALAKLLNPNGCSNWESLAAAMKLSAIDIRNIERVASPTESLLFRYETSREFPTIEGLMQLFIDINRLDCFSHMRTALESVRMSEV